LFAFVVGSLLISLVTGALLFVVFWTAVKLKNNDGLDTLPSQGFFFPFKLIPYFIIAIVISVVVSINIRDVDSNLGDSWTINITDSVTLLTIDTLDRWRFSPTEGGEAISDKIKSISVTDKIAFGEDENGSYFIYDKSKSNYATYQKEYNFKNKLTEYGMVNFDLISPTDYYYKERQFGDNVMLLLIFIYPLFKLYRLLKQFKSAT
jgi:hypothetical protein